MTGMSSLCTVNAIVDLYKKLNVGSIHHSEDINYLTCTMSHKLEQT